MVPGRCGKAGELTYNEAWDMDSGRRRVPQGCIVAGMRSGSSRPVGDDRKTGEAFEKLSDSLR